ncbi:MAG: hypothetical protein KF767_08570 [Bdellovibrionaceae bacterium]|nr:hypothetical protein [Pseudobdellovibrionaceae bacterium]
MSDWKYLSFITAIVVFFSGMSPVSAAPKSVKTQILTPKIEASLNHPRFACQILWVRIQDEDREELEMLLSSLSHIDQVGKRSSVDVETHAKYTTFKIQSVMWVPGGQDFKNDFRALRELASLDIVGCQMFTQTPKK